MGRDERPPSVRFAIRVTPRAGADRVEGVADGALRLRVASPPIDGEANAAACRLLATELGVGRGNVRVVSGATGRRKLVEVDGVDSAALRTRWPGLAV
jgi:uncharacterized protein